jgi:hypothetical protein
MKPFLGGFMEQCDASDGSRLGTETFTRVQNETVDDDAQRPIVLPDDGDLSRRRPPHIFESRIL